MTDSLDELIQKHLDGRTSKEEAETLSSRIVADKEIRSRYLKAAQIHGALADETLALDLEAEPIAAMPEPQKVIWHFAWPRQIAAGLVAGMFVGLLGVGMVWAIGSPKAEARVFNIAHGDFESLAVGPMSKGFPVRFGEWGGNPAEVVKEASGNKILRLVRTANVKGDPGGFASNCSVFQLVDLSALRQQWEIDPSQAHYSLKLSARFRRDPAPSDAELQKPKASVRIFLFQSEPESIREAWPRVVQQAEALGKKSIKLEPGDDAATLSTSCILDSDATVALIAVAASAGYKSATSVPLGGYFVDDVQLTLIKQPKLPVQVVSR
jgi:anti-sigma factor RsiW